MLRRQMAAMAVLVSLWAVPAQAQLMLTMSGGATVPLEDFDKYASTGWMGTLGLLKPVGGKGLGLGGEGYYGQNSHSNEAEGSKSTLYGLLGTVTWRFGSATKPNVFVLGNAGYMTHSISFDNAPNLDGAEDGFAYGAGAGVAIPRGKMSWYLVARYLTADIEDAKTTLAPIMLGVSFPIGK